MTGIRIEIFRRDDLSGRPWQILINGQRYGLLYDNWTRCLEALQTLVKIMGEETE